MGVSVSTYIRRHHLGLIAIFIALSGTAWAGTQIGPRDVKNNAIRAKHVRDGQIGTAEVANDSTARALTGTDIAAEALSGGDVAPDSLSGADINESSLFNDDSLDAADIADTSSLGTTEVDEANLFNDDSLAANDISNGAVGSGEIANNTITSDDIVDSGSIEADLDGDFSTGAPPTAANPESAFLAVVDNLVGISEATQGGGSSVLTVDTEGRTITTSGSTDVDINNGFVELDEITAPGNPGATAARLYVVDAGAMSSLVVDFANSLPVVLATG